MAAVTEPEYLTTTQLALRLHVSVETVRVWRKSGRIAPSLVTPGGAPRWEWSAVREALAPQSCATSP